MTGTEILQALSALGGVSTFAWLAYLLNVTGMQDRLFQRRLQAEQDDKRVALREKDAVISGLRGELNSLKLLGIPETKARIEDLLEQRQSSNDELQELEKTIASLRGDVVTVSTRLKAREHELDEVYTEDLLELASSAPKQTAVVRITTDDIWNSILAMGRASPPFAAPSMLLAQEAGGFRDDDSSE